MILVQPASQIFYAYRLKRRVASHLHINPFRRGSPSRGRDLT